MGTTFALVHGAWHGAWCWERLLGPLRERGFEVVTVDLPCEDVEAGLEADADVIAGALRDVDGDVMAVGHSLGGLPLTLVAARRPVRAVVYLAAFVPSPGESMTDQFRSSPEPVLLFEGGRELDDHGRSRWVDADTTARILYPDLPDGVAAWAFPQLRWQAATSQREPHPTDLPDVPAVSFVCTADRIVNPAWSRRVSLQRLGVEPIELPGGHFPMLTAPDALADALARLHPVRTTP
jgi:pimeloyl-ACP methyl ester carboxylesterase